VIADPGVLGNDVDFDGPALAAIIAAPPLHGTLVLTANGGFAYEPDPGFLGTDSFAYQAWDGALLSNVAPVVLHIGAFSEVASITGGGRFCLTGTACGHGEEATVVVTLQVKARGDGASR
jgi:hypothetical protein